MPPPMTSSRSGMLGELERAGGVDDARSSSGRNGQRDRLGAGRDDRSARRRRSVVADASSVFGPVNSPVPCTTCDLALLGQAGRPPVSWPTTPSFHARSVSRSISGSPKAMPCLGELLGLGDAPWRRAAAPWTGCSRRSGRRRRALVALDEHDLQPEVGGAEGGGVAARAGAEHDHLDLHVGVGRVGRSARGPVAGSARELLGGRASGSPPLGWASVAGAAARRGVQREDDGALGDLVADRDRELRRPCPPRATGPPSSPCRTRA